MKGIVIIMNNDNKSKTYIKSKTYTMTHTETIIMYNDWSYRYDCIMKEYNIPSYAARNIQYDPQRNETTLKFTWSTIEKGII